MKKKLLLTIFSFWLGLFFYLYFFRNIALAQVTPTPLNSINFQPTPIPCPLGDCPSVLSTIGVSCKTTYEDFLKDPVENHYWAFDPEVTAQGKTNDRARQFIYWVFQRGAVDNHPILKEIWRFSANIVFFLIILVTAFLGIGIIVGQKSDFDLRVQVWPIFIKIGLILLYTAFSASIILLLINISELLMKFFIESFGGRNLFNIYFSGESIEENYTTFIGCRDLNLKVQEAVNSELFLLNLTNITYYVMGSMIVLRKIILWFLLFVSPFLAILIPFTFIRNIGWIWIGVFFQWLFYGPLFALFLGSLIRIWNAGIPFVFFFGRAGQREGYIFPTAINIVYGGPSQKGLNAIGALNNGNYIDTFAEYIVSLLMLWAVIILPWWLLRIFRDYCCDGIYAARNILMSMYEQMRSGPTPQGPILPTQPLPSQVSLKVPQKIEIPIKVKLETIEEIKKATTEEIIKHITYSQEERINRLTNIAHFETNKQIQETVRKNIEYLSNPLKAETPNEKQKYMTIRNEIFNRAIKEDKLAKNILSTLSTSRVEQIQKKQEIAKTIPQPISATHLVSIKVKVPKQQTTTITNQLVKTALSKTNLVNAVSQKTNTSVNQIQQILQSLTKHIDQPVGEITQKISKDTNIEQTKVINVLKTFSEKITATPEISPQEKEVAKQLQTIAEPEKNIEETIPVPPTVSLEDYENVKRMWKKQYQEGEVPITENIKSREQWVKNDIIFITNTLNKLVSPNEEIRQQGLDDLGYILPIFLLNNLKGEEIIVYLKAKLEAAKSVAELLEKEKEITEKLKEKSEEELVEVERPRQKEAAKEMTMEQEKELEPPEEKKTRLQRENINKNSETETNPSKNNLQNIEKDNLNSPEEEKVN